MILWFIINIYLVSIPFLVWSSEKPSNLLSEDRESYVNGVIFGKPLSNLRMGVSFQGNHPVIRRLELSVPTAAAKLLQSCLTLCDPIDGSPPGSPVPGILQARTLEWVAISFSNACKWKVKVKSLSHVRQIPLPTLNHRPPPPPPYYLPSNPHLWRAERD